METVPQVINSPTPLPASPSWKKKLPYLFIGILIVIILAEAVWGFRLLSSAPPSSANGDLPIIDSVRPQLILLPAKNQLQVGETVPVAIKVVTAGKPTDSVDILIKYDPTQLEASGSNFFELGAIYPEYPVAEINPKQGLIQISATNPINQPGFSGIGTLATLNFKAKAKGVTTLSIDFQKNSTADSNLVLSGSNQDILDQVSDATIQISQQPVQPSTSEVTACDGFFQYCQIGEKTGKQYCQNGAIKDNVCTFDPVLTVGCSECQLQ